MIALNMKVCGEFKLRIKKKKKKHEWMGSHQRNDIYSHISLYHLHATMGAAGDDTIGANNESRKTTRRDFIRGT